MSEMNETQAPEPAETPTPANGQQPEANKEPNRFLYHVAGVWQFGNMGGHAAEAILMAVPISMPQHINEIQTALASRVKARGPNGAAMVGVKATFVVVNFILLRYWYDEKPVKVGEQATTPDGQPVATLLGN